MAFEPTISVNYDGAPRAEVFFPSFAPGTATVSVFRESEGRTMQVRGGVRAVTAGTLSRIDHEIPARKMTYWAEMFDAAGLSLGITGSTSVTAWFEDTWLHNPLDPQGSVRVMFRPQAARELSRPVAGQVVHPQGRRVGVVVGTERKGLMGVNLDVVTDTIEDADKVRALLGDYNTTTVPVLCFRIGALDRIRLPSPLFVGVLDIVEADRNYASGWGEMIDHLIEGDEVDPPLPGLFIPTLRNADLKAYYATNAAMKADNPTNGDLLRRYDLAGMASAV